MMRARWLLLAGGVLVGVGLIVPTSAFVAALDSEASGARLEQLRLGAWLFKALLCLHGGWLLLSCLGMLDRLRRRGPTRQAQSRTSVWTPVTETDEPIGVWASSLLLPVLLGIAAVLRWIGVHQDLWHDEIFTLIDFVRPSLGRILTDYSSDNQHLLYSVLAHASTRLFGEGPASLRLPAVLLGLASLWATLRLGCLTLGRRQAVLAAALLTVSYHHVWFSQNARGYTGLLLVTALSTDLFLRGLWSDRWSLWIAYASALAIGMAFHPTMIFVAAAHGIALLWLLFRPADRPRSSWRPVGALVLAGTLTLQIYAFVLPQMLELYLQPSAGADTSQFRWKSPLWLINETLRGLDIGLGFGWLGLAGAGLLFALGLYGLLVRSRLTTVCFLLPPILGGATMVLLGRNLWPRFFFNAATFAALIAVQGAWLLGALATRWLDRSGRGLSVFMASLLVLASLVTLPKVYRYPKQDFTGAKRFVEQQWRPGDRIVALDLAADAYRGLYAPKMAVAYSLEELESEHEGSNTTWILYTLAEHLATTKPDLWEAVQRDYEVVRTFPGTLNGGTIVVRRSLTAGRDTTRSGSHGGSPGRVADEFADAPKDVHQ